LAAKASLETYPMRAFCNALAACLLLTLVAACAPRAEPAIWRIVDEDSEIWLYGTVHILPPDLHWRGARVNAAFAAADELMTEIDTSAETARVTQALALVHGSLPEGQTLSALLGPEDAARLDARARELGLDRAVLDRMRPWMAAIQLSYAYAVRRGHRAEAGVENVLAAEAQQRGMQRSFLETPEDQILVLARLPEADQLRLFRAGLREIEANDGSLEEIDQAWARGDVALLTQLLDDDWAEAGPEVYEALIVRRNQAWVDAIQARLNGSGRIFIAVGAAHLAGDRNVIALLRARGVEVEGP